MTLSHRWGGLLAIVLLIGLVGGLALGALTAARRTQSAFPAYLRSTNPSDLTVLSALYEPDRRQPAGFDANVVRNIARLPHVTRVESYAGVNVAVLAPNGAVSVNASGLPGSIDGEYFDQDRATVVEGRMADPTRADEVVMDAKNIPPGLHVGAVAPLGFFTNAQEQLPNFGRVPIKPYLRINARIVGKVEYSKEVVQDDVDTGLNGGVLFTPALTRRLTHCCVNFSDAAIRIEGGGRNLAAVQAGIERALPKGFPVVFYVTAITQAKAEQAVKPESIALGVFGGIAALAALLIAGQVIGRQLRAGADELRTLRALGAGPAMTVGDGLPGILGAVVAGSLLAVVVAAGLSPLSPLGSVRSVYPDIGVAFDWTVLGAGLLVLIGGLWAVALVLAYRRAPHRAAGRGRAWGRGSSVARAAAGSGLPAPAIEGMRLALDPRASRNTVPVRSAILGAALAMIVVVATVIFGASLDTLVSHPGLYGWNWTYSLTAGNPTFVSQHRAAALLDHDPEVAAWTGVYFDTLDIDGQTVPVIGASPHAAVAPPILSGHGLDAPSQVVLGAVTMARLHKHRGDYVDVRATAARPTRLRIVGTATLPSVGIDATLHTEMGTGAVLPSTVIPGSPGAGPNDIWVRLRPGANLVTERRKLQQLVPAENGGVVSSVQRPAEIVNYRTMGKTPALLGAALAAGAVVALGLTLVASVRRRRRDLALFKTLGFTRRQLAATVAWQASVAVLLGAVVGVPLGIVIGRALWRSFANALHVVPAPTVPAVTIALIALGALLLANLVAAVPGRQAARTRTAVLLHAE